MQNLCRVSLDSVDLSGLGLRDLPTGIGQMIINVAQRDINNISNESTDNSIQMNTVYTRKWAQIAGDVRLNELSQEISQIKTALAAERRGPDNEQATTAIAEAFKCSRERQWPEGYRSSRNWRFLSAGCSNEGGC